MYKLYILLWTKLLSPSLLLGLYQEKNGNHPKRSNQDHPGYPQVDKGQTLIKFSVMSLSRRKKYSMPSLKTWVQRDATTSSIEAETLAIMVARDHTSVREGQKLIHTGSRPALHSLQHSVPNDSIYLLTTVLTIAQRILARMSLLTD